MSRMVRQLLTHLLTHERGEELRAQAGHDPAGGAVEEPGSHARGQRPDRQNHQHLVQNCCITRSHIPGLCNLGNLSHKVLSFQIQVQVYHKPYVGEKCEYVCRVYP